MVGIVNYLSLNHLIDFEKGKSRTDWWNVFLDNQATDWKHHNNYDVRVINGNCMLFICSEYWPLRPYIELLLFLCLSWKDSSLAIVLEILYKAHLQDCKLEANKYELYTHVAPPLPTD